MRGGRIAPFMPPVLGTQQIGNFAVTSLPATGTWMMVVFSAIVVALASWQVLHVTRTPSREEA